MIHKEKYTNIDRVLQCLITQVQESIFYCQDNFPKWDSPEEMFKILKLNVTYKTDPKDVELLMTVPTFFDNNYWDKSGYGDCDDFTILTLACCYANNWNDNAIVLKGRSKKNPVHIYSSTFVNGQNYTLDLTNPYIDIEREYPLSQTLQIKTLKL